MSAFPSFAELTPSLITFGGALLGAYLAQSYAHRRAEDRQERAEFLDALDRVLDALAALGDLMDDLELAGTRPDVHSGALRLSSAHLSVHQAWNSYSVRVAERDSAAFESEIRNIDSLVLAVLSVANEISETDDNAARKALYAGLEGAGSNFTEAHASYIERAHHWSQTRPSRSPRVRRKVRAALRRDSGQGKRR